MAEKNNLQYDCRASASGKRRFENPEVYQKTLEFQQYLKEQGIAWHNQYSDECNDDFGCCEGLGNYHTFFPSYHSSAKQLFKELFEEIKHGDKEHQDWLKDKMDAFLRRFLWES